MRRLINPVICRMKSTQWLLPANFIEIRLLFWRSERIIDGTEQCVAIVGLHHGLAPASRCHFIPVLTAGRQSRRLYVVPRTNRKTADRAFSTAAPRAWNQLPTELKKHNRHLPFAEDWKRSFSTVHTAPNNTWYNHYVMRPRSYSRGLRNRKTYANANANRRHGQGIIIDWLIDWLIDRSIAFVHLSNN